MAPLSLNALTDSLAVVAAFRILSATSLTASSGHLSAIAGVGVSGFLVFIVYDQHSLLISGLAAYTILKAHLITFGQ
jgi:hypothetical protein